MKIIICFRQINCWIGYKHKNVDLSAITNKKCWTNKKCLCVQNKLKLRNVVDVKDIITSLFFQGCSTTKQLLDLSTFDLWMILPWWKAFGPLVNTSDVSISQSALYIIHYLPASISSLTPFWHVDIIYYKRQLRNTILNDFKLQLWSAHP
jgi:hypothetical protein